MSFKLTLSKRAGQIGPSINTRTEKHGEEDVPGLDIPVTGIFLDAEELGVLLQDPEAHTCLFTKSRSVADEPRFDSLAPLKIDGKFTDAKVLITVGEHQVHFKPAKVKSIELEPQVGGMTMMSCTIQGNPSSNTDVLELLNAKCRIQITGGEMETKNDDQPELPMGHDTQVSPPEKPTRGRKPRVRADIDG